MTDRDRLKENITTLNIHGITHKPVHHITNGKKYELQLIHEIVEDVSLILEKMENQKLVEIPCNVNQMVYVPWNWEGEQGIAVVKVEEIRIYDSKNHIMFLIDLQSDDEEYNQSFGGWKLDKSIGKTVFLTKEEAEQKLKELKDNA